ncbi:hypothetical protein D3C78_884140 [compost metagenome]
MQQGHPGKRQWHTAQRRQHGQLDAQTRQQEDSHQQGHGDRRRQSYRAKLAGKTTRVVQQRLPVTSQQQAEQTEQLQQGSHQAGQHRRQQIADPRLLVRTHLLVGLAQHLRHQLEQLGGVALDRLAEYGIDDHAIQHTEQHAGQQHPRPGDAGTQHQGQDQRAEQHQQRPRLAEVPPQQGRQQRPGHDAQGIVETAAQHHQRAGGRAHPEQQGQRRRDDHREGGLQASTHDEVSQCPHLLRPLTCRRPGLNGRGCRCRAAGPGSGRA